MSIEGPITLTEGSDTVILADAAELDAAQNTQLAYARDIAGRIGADLPEEVQMDRAALSAWISAHRPARVAGRFDNYPSSKQVAFAERIARIKRRNVPDECFKDRGLLSKWIDHNR